MSEGLSITIDTSQWERFGRKLGDTAGLEYHFHNGMQGSLDLLTEWIAQETPVNLGILRGSWQTDTRGEALSLTGEVATTLIYGWPVEMGRRPGKMPPVDAIKMWARRKLGLEGAELDQAAFLIARSIGRHGTKGAYMVQQAYNKAKDGPEIAAIFSYELDRYLAELVK